MVNYTYIYCFAGSLMIVYAIIFMIWLETKILNDGRFNQYIQLYKRFIHKLIWTCPAAVLCELWHALAIADEAISSIISLDWSGYESQQDAVNPKG